MISFEIISEISDIEVVARGRAIRNLARLQKQYGSGRWRKMKGGALIRLTNRRIRKAEIHWYEAHGIGKKSSSANDMWIKPMSTRKISSQQFVICIDNSEYPASLELHKIYRIVPDEEAKRDGDLRIIDESGEDYLYPAKYFVSVNLPRTIVRTLKKAYAQST